MSLSFFFGFVHLDPSNIAWRVSHASFVDFEESMSPNILSYTLHWIACRVVKFLDVVFLSSQFQSNIGLTVVSPLTILVGTD